MKMGFVIYEGTIEEVEKKMKNIEANAKEGYPDFYLKEKEGFEIKTKDMRIYFSMDTITKDVYGIYQIFY